MTNTKTPHTPEPWKVGGKSYEWNSPSSPRIDILRDVTYVEGLKPTTYLIGHVCYPTSMDGTVGACEREANARRIVACVNACKGIPTEVLEASDMQAANLDREKELNLANEQREELVKAAKLAVLNFERTNHGNPDQLGDDDFEAWTALNKAIAKCEVK